MRLSSLTPLLAVLLGGCVTVPAAPLEWTTASSDPAVITLMPAKYGPYSGVTKQLRDHCQLDRRLPERIASSSPVAVTLADDPTGAAQVLHIRVSRVSLPEGHALSGIKPFIRDMTIGQWTSMTIAGELFERRGDEWRRIASFEARRTTSGGTLDACGTLSNLSKRLAKDVSRWLAEPTLHTRLGQL